MASRNEMNRPSLQNNTIRNLLEDDLSDYCESEFSTDDEDYLAPTQTAGGNDISASSSDEDDIPLARRARPRPTPTMAHVSETESDSSSDIMSGNDTDNDSVANNSSDEDWDEVVGLENPRQHQFQFLELTGPKHAPPADSPPMAYFYMFFTIPLLQLIARETNRLCRFLGVYGPMVKILDCSYAVNMDDEDVRILLIQCPNLTDLDFSNCKYVFFLKTVHMFNACRQLKSINLSNCSLENESISLLLKCWMNDPKGIISEHAVPRYLKSKYGQYHLESGKFQLNPVVEDLETEDLLIPLNPVAGVEVLNLSGNEKLTDTCLAYMEAASPALAKLKVLELRGCYQLTGKALNALVSVCPALDPEKISYCDRITDGPFVNKAKG